MQNISKTYEFHPKLRVKKLQLFILNEHHTT